MNLVLSLFPGIGMFDYAFEQEGFCVVRGPDVLWGGRIEKFHPPQCFAGIIGGDPCQSHSSLANMVRAKGLEPSFPDMTPEFLRVINEVQPAWFLRENTPKAPDISPDGYDVCSFELDNSCLDRGDGHGHEQMRTRRFWFGTREREAPELRAHIDFALFLLPDDERQGPPCGHGDTPGQRDRFRVSAVGGNDGTADSIDGYRKARDKARTAPKTGRHDGKVGTPDIDYSPPRRTLEEMLRLQGFPENWMEHQPWTMQAKRKMVGNGVALPTGRALAKAIRLAMMDAPA